MTTKVSLEQSSTYDTALQTATEQVDGLREEIEMAERIVTTQRHYLDEAQDRLDRAQHRLEAALLVLRCVENGRPA